MTSLTVQDGKLVVRNGALGTTQACCCGGGGGCPSSCDQSNPCPEGCGECCSGECTPCPMPSQITLSLSGMGRLFAYGAGNNQQASFGGLCPDANSFSGLAFKPVFCGECAAPEAWVGDGGGGVFGRWSGRLISQDFDNVVLDRDEASPCWTYRGFAPSTPSASWFQNQAQVYDCEGGNLTVPITVAITPTDISTSVVIDGPPWGQYGATANATVSGGSVTGITITNSGGGYAREILTRSQPTITAAITGGTGTGATLSVTLTQNGTGEQATWSVSSVSVTNGGTGYAGHELVEFTPESGATAVLWAVAQLTVGRAAPTVTASVSSGSGGTLSVTLAEGFDWWSGQSYWYVESVAVTNGGTGYTDGEQVAFTVTDGVEEYSASATISAPSGEVELVYISSGGSYYKSTGIVQSVQVPIGGEYYLETSTGAAEMRTPNVYISSRIGSGATATATVNGTVGSPNFGKVTAITVSDGGENYVASGFGWLLTIEGLDVGHRAIQQFQPEPSDDAGEDCRTKADGRFELIASRVSMAACPTELLGKSYSMVYQFRRFYTEPFPPAYDLCTWTELSGQFQLENGVIFGFAGSDIEVSISPG